MSYTLVQKPVGPQIQKNVVAWFWVLSSSVSYQRCLVSCMNELSTNLGTVFLARLVVGNLSEVVLPILKVHTRQ